MNTILVDAIHDSATVIYKGKMMNNFTKSLAMQYAHKMGNSVLYNAERMEAFAELIVRECARVCESTPLIGPYKDVQDATLKDAATEIKEHFGVEP